MKTIIIESVKAFIYPLFPDHYANHSPVDCELYYFDL